VEVTICLHLVPRLKMRLPICFHAVHRGSFTFTHCLKKSHCFSYGNPHYQNKSWFISQTGMEAGERLFSKLVNGYRMEQPPYATNAM
jgi:hypothetical protein